MTGATSTVHTPPHHSTRKGSAEEDDEDDDCAPGFHVHHHQRDPWHADEIGMCQLGGARLVPKEMSRY